MTNFEERWLHERNVLLQVYDGQQVDLFFLLDPSVSCWKQNSFALVKDLELEFLLSCKRFVHVCLRFFRSKSVDPNILSRFEICGEEENVLSSFFPFIEFGQLSVSLVSFQTSPILTTEKKTWWEVGFFHISLKLVFWEDILLKLDLSEMRVCYHLALTLAIKSLDNYWGEDGDQNNMIRIQQSYFHALFILLMHFGGLSPFANDFRHCKPSILV